MQIIELKNETFDKQYIINLLEKKNCLIGVFSKSCIHCNDMKPQWQILKKKLKKITCNGVLLEIDASLLDYIDFSTLKNSIDGLPAIMIFKNGKKVKDYVGNRTSNDMFKFLKQYLVINNKKTKNKNRNRNRNRNKKTVKIDKKLKN